jgi:hypothetical protein
MSAQCGRSSSAALFNDLTSLPRAFLASLERAPEMNAQQSTSRDAKSESARIEIATSLEIRFRLEAGVQITSRVG